MYKVFLVLCFSLGSITSFGQTGEELQAVEHARSLSQKKDYKSFYQFVLERPNIAKFFHGDAELRKAVFEEFKMALEDEKPRLKELRSLLGTFLITAKGLPFSENEKTTLIRFGARQGEEDLALYDQSRRLLLEAIKTNQLKSFLQIFGPIITSLEMPKAKRASYLYFKLRQGTEGDSEVLIQLEQVRTENREETEGKGFASSTVLERRGIPNLTKEQLESLELKTALSETQFRKYKISSEKISDSDREAVSRGEKKSQKISKKAIRKLPSDVEKAAELSEGSQSKGTDPASLERGNERTKESRTTRESKERDGRKGGRESKK